MVFYSLPPPVMVLAGVCSLYFSPPLDAREREERGGRGINKSDTSIYFLPNCQDGPLWVIQCRKGVGGGGVVAERVNLK